MGLKKLTKSNVGKKTFKGTPGTMTVKVLSGMKSEYSEMLYNKGVEKSVKVS